ncbi:MAG: DUF983 domain-containing protein [Acidobacteriota bacterium]|nr:DUF983 domain-containing protein [Acidobacteriota bacterium]
MKRDCRTILKTLGWCLMLRCPACGQSSIIQSPFVIKHSCPACEALFKREDGFFVGAILTNMVITEFVVLVAYLIFLPAINSHYQIILALLLAVALLFPVIFYHHSWSVWLSFDHLIETLPKADE